MKILIAADGSSYTRAAARYVARHFPNSAQIELLHVHPTIPSGIAAGALGKKAVESYQRDESRKALAPAEKELEKAGVAFRSSWSAGDAAHQIAAYAADSGADLIVIGSHGHTALASLAMGSVTTKLIALAKVPVLVVTRQAASGADRKQRGARGDRPE